MAVIAKLVDDVSPETITNSDFAAFLEWAAARIKTGTVKMGHVQWTGNEFFVLALGRIEVEEPTEFEGEPPGETMFTTYTLGNNAAELYDSVIDEDYNIVLNQEGQEGIEVSRDEVESVPIPVLDQAFRNIVDWTVETGRFLTPHTAEWTEQWTRIAEELTGVFKGTHDPLKEKRLAEEVLQALEWAVYHGRFFVGNSQEWHEGWEAARKVIVEARGR